MTSFSFSANRRPLLNEEDLEGANTIPVLATPYKSTAMHFNDLLLIKNAYVFFILQWKSTLTVG